ncbi:MAG: response regulator [Candidatus Moraniibacteriota bacterium]
MAKILLVEDDPMISEVYMTKFKASGIDADLAESGHAVLQKAKENKYDLVLLDIVLPEMNGMEVLEELRTKPEYDKDLKVVMFSNLSEKSDRDRALQLGANGFVPKTEFSPSQLVAEVSRFLRQFEEQKKHALRASDGTAVESKNKNILFVEDEAVFCDMFGGQLEKEGYSVTYLDGGMNAVQAAVEKPFDMVVTDMAIREMNGLDVIRLVRESSINSATPIILFSASVDDAQFAEAKNLGADSCFLKTRLTPSELLKEVGRLITQKK